MPLNDDPDRERLVDAAARAARERAPEGEGDCAEALARLLFHGVALEDLQERAESDLAGAALANLAFVRERPSPGPSVRVYNPSAAVDGWTSTHSVLVVLNDDMPFIVDSLATAVTRAGAAVHLTIHPLLKVRRDPGGRLVEICDPRQPPGEVQVESLVQIEFDRETDPASIAALEEEVKLALCDVRAAVEDWPQMRDRARLIASEVGAGAPVPLPRDVLVESRAFLSWLAEDNFTFLGFREYRYAKEGEVDVLYRVPRSGLGIMRDTSDQPVPSNLALPVSPAERQLCSSLLTITKANAPSRVHRPGFMDYIGVRVVDEEGVTVGEQRFLGLFTSTAYSRNPQEVPLLRHKVTEILDRSGYHPSSHAGKELLHILVNLPRDELFQASAAELESIASGLLQLQGRQKVKLFVRRDPFERFFSCLVYIPREAYDTRARLKVQRMLTAELGGGSAQADVTLSESNLARVHCVVRTPDRARRNPDVAAIERAIAAALRSWRDRFREALVARRGEEGGLKCFKRFGREGVFSAAYREDVSPDVAAEDVEEIESLEGDGALRVRFFRPAREGTGAGGAAAKGGEDGQLRLKLIRRGRPVPIFEVLPLLENLGLDVISERPYSVRPGPAARGREDEVYYSVQEFRSSCALIDCADPAEVEPLFRDAFLGTWGGEAENDGFNRLVLGARLTWRQVALLRAVCKYVLQTGLPYSQNYIERIVGAHPDLARLFVEGFEARFDPSLEIDARAGRMGEAAAEIARRLDAVPSIDEDRVLRAFASVIEACLRTNYFQPRWAWPPAAGGDADAAGEAGGQAAAAGAGGPKPYLAFKLDPSRIPDLPRPLPRFEIFVSSTRVEGVHLRGGEVARGGLRWSDRPEDFRTEVLGLMKAQMVKNTLIVPVGAKGGFVVKRPPEEGGREALLAEVTACYKTFIGGLLDLTDNRVGGVVVTPPGVVRHDRDDPYLVVAADKGTATFSDLANGVARDYGFWLGDAFASGGSNGYDHKKMGITARGAWESVKRHFREVGRDIQEEPFTAAGIGDMSGDVFGNGMLLSRQTKLVAAFNHLHIFLDPDPDPGRSFAERERLFRLPRSTWDDYDRSALSAGGGVFSRADKRVPLSPEVRALLGVEAADLRPQELIRAVLRMEVDLLWVGGIGTYVKASAESNLDAGDPANDALRVDADELRCKVVGEGGNLGFTQRARVEYALRGGLCYTDFVDNSGGVNCSDREVNIKVLLDGLRAAGEIDEDRRSALLAKMTPEVAARVLRDNDQQCQALSVAAAGAPGLLDEHAHFIRLLEAEGTLDRGLEFLPSDEVIDERRKAGRGLTRPELALVYAYGKVRFNRELLGSGVLDDPYLGRELEIYFPPPLPEIAGGTLTAHPLRREIVATCLTNSVVHRLGPAFPYRVGEATGAGAGAVARAYAIARDSFGLRGLWGALEELQGRAPSTQVYDLVERTGKSLQHVTRWVLGRLDRHADTAAAVDFYRSGVDELIAVLPGLPGVPGAFAEGVQGFCQLGLAEDDARRLAALDYMYVALDVVEVAAETGSPAAAVAASYFALGDVLDLDWIRPAIEGLPASGHWQGLARATLREGYFSARRDLVAEVIQKGPAEARAEAAPIAADVAAWVEENRDAVERARRSLAQMNAAGQADFPTLTVALQTLRRLLG